MLTLYDYYRSSACFRVRIALQLKNIPHELASVHLVNNGGEQHSDEYKKINPFAAVPTLMIDDRPLTQSLAIIEYLNETNPAPALLPADPYTRALARSFALTIAADIHPLDNLRVLKYLMNELNINEDQKNKWYQHWIIKGFDALEKQLAHQNRQTPFCFGDEPSIADICLAPQMYNARRFNCDLTPYPTLVRIDAHCQSQAAFKAAWPVEVPA